MKLANVLFSFCVLLDIIHCKNIKRSARRRQERNEHQNISSPVVIALELQEILENVEKFNERIVNILAVLDGKIDRINDKLSGINELDHKINELINQNEKCLDDEKKFVAALEIIETPETINLDAKVQKILDSLELFEDKVQHNFSENGKKLDDITKTIFEKHLNKNLTTMQIQRNQRKEHRIAGEKNLINHILSMVRKKLKNENGELKNLTGTVSSMTDIFSSFESMKPLASEPKNKTSPKSRGITFPSVKNKPAKLNTTFMSDAFGIRDIRVSYYVLNAEVKIILFDRNFHLLVFRDFHALS